MSDSEDTDYDFKPRIPESFVNLAGNDDNPNSDIHLLASLNQARESIASLEIANKDLLDALSALQKELTVEKSIVDDKEKQIHALTAKIDRIQHELTETNEAKGFNNFSVKSPTFISFNLFYYISFHRSNTL